MLEVVGRTLPGIWTRHAAWREAQFETTPWPSWCYAPLAATGPLFDRPLLAAKVCALASWRMTQGIYRVDPTLMAALLETPLDGAIPVDVLQRMPEWCVYIELEALPTLKGLAHGVWAWVEPGQAAGGVLLGLLFDIERQIASSIADDDAMFVIALQLKGGSLMDALQAMYPSDVRLHDWFHRAVAPVLSILLYVCSRNADITSGGLPATSTRPAPVRTRRHGLRLYAADQATSWDLGVRIGAALRAALASDRSDVATGRKVTPHVRRFHWHTYLFGRKDQPSELRRREIRWMAPISIGITDPGQLVSTIKPLK